MRTTSQRAFSGRYWRVDPSRGLSPIALAICPGDGTPRRGRARRCAWRLGSVCGTDLAMVPLCLPDLCDNFIPVGALSPFDVQADPTAVSVNAPGRLHLGFLDPSGTLGRRFGSLGLMIEGFETDVGHRVCQRRRVGGRWRGRRGGTPTCRRLPRAAAPAHGPEHATGFAPASRAPGPCRFWLGHPARIGVGAWLRALAPAGAAHRTAGPLARARAAFGHRHRRLRRGRPAGRRRPQRRRCARAVAGAGGDARSLARGGGARHPAARGCPARKSARRSPASRRSRKRRRPTSAIGC